MGWVGLEGDQRAMLIFVWSWRVEGEIVHRHGSRAQQGGKQGAGRFLPGHWTSKHSHLFTSWSVHAFRRARRRLKGPAVAGTPMNLHLSLPMERRK